MENLDSEQILGYLSSSVGHQIINAYSTIVSQGEILRSLTSPVQENRSDIDERVDTIIRTALDASLMTRSMIELSHEVTAIHPDRPGSGVVEVHLDRVVSE